MCSREYGVSYHAVSSVAALSIGASSMAFSTAATKRVQARASGFSLVELLVALAIVGLVMAAAVPASARFYDSLQRREAIRETRNLFLVARERALSSGRVQDVMVKPNERRIWLGDKEIILPEGQVLTVHGAAELNRARVGVIRFYPDGSSSGGGVDIAASNGGNTRISVDWLIGRVEIQQNQAG